MVTNIGCIIASLAVLNLVSAQNSTDIDSLNGLQWLNGLIMVPNVEMQNELAAGTAVNLNPEEVAQTVCKNENGAEGVCVLHYQCEPRSRSLIKDGNSLLDIRYGVCPNVLEVCCINRQTNTVSVGDAATENNNAVRLQSNMFLFVVLQVLVLGIRSKSLFRLLVH